MPYHLLHTSLCSPWMNGLLVSFASRDRATGSRAKHKLMYVCMTVPVVNTIYAQTGYPRIARPSYGSFRRTDGEGFGGMYVPVCILPTYYTYIHMHMIGSVISVINVPYVWIYDMYHTLTFTAPIWSGETWCVIQSHNSNTAFEAH